MKNPSLAGQAILGELIKHIETGNVLPGDPSTFIGYKLIHDSLDLPLVAETYGDSLKKQGLADLAYWTHDEKLPAITGLIVSQDSLLPGRGYFELFDKRADEDFLWWRNEIERSLAFNWKPFVVFSEPVKEKVDTPNSMRIHIAISSDLEALELAAKNGGRFDWWNLSKAARIGDPIIFYVTEPVSAFVAFGVVDSETIPCPDPDSQWVGQPCFWVRDARMARHLTLAEAKLNFPDWSYLVRPVKACIPNKRTPPTVVNRLLELLNDVPAPTPDAFDLMEPPPRILATAYRILRDTDLARQVKRMHNYECQICGHTIHFPDGSRYAEAHHIQPLGTPHNGCDGISNIMCVCPNHHAELDYGVIPIELSALRQANGHLIGLQFVEYHNKNIYNH